MAEVPLILKTRWDGIAAEQGLNRLKRNITNLQSSLSGAFTAVVGVIGVRELIRATDAAINTKNAFEALETQTQRLGISAQSLLSDLQDVTQGQVSLRDLTTSASTAIALLGEESIPRLSELADIAARASTALATDLTGAFSDMVRGIGRQSRLILDNLGLVIDAEQAYDDYAESIGKAADALTEAERKQAFLNAAIEQGYEKYGDITPAVNAFDQIRAAATNLFDILLGKLFGGEVEGGFSSLAGAIYGLAESIKGIPAEEIQQIAIDLGKIVATIAGIKILGTVFAAVAAPIATIIGVLKILRANLLMQKFLPDIVRLGEVWQVVGTSATELGTAGRIAAEALRFLNNTIYILRTTLTAMGEAIATKITPAVLLLSGAWTAINQIWDNVVESGGHLWGILSNVWEWISRNVEALANMIVKTEAWHEIVAILNNALDYLETAIRLVGIGIDTLFGVVNILLGGLADLAEWLNTGVLKFDNFYSAAINAANGVITLINQVRALSGFPPLSMIVNQLDLAAAARVRTGVSGNLFGGPANSLSNRMDIITAEQRAAGIVTTPYEPTGGGTGGGGAVTGLIDDEKRRTEEENIKWLRELARAAEALSEEFLDSINVMKEMNEILAAPATAASGIMELITGSPARQIARAGRMRGFGGSVAEEIESVFDRFINNLAEVMGDFLENWGWRGGEPDWLGLGRKAFSPLTGSWGADIAAALNLGKSFAGFFGGAISGLAGWGINRLIGEKPLEIEQPIDIRIIDIETHLLNFFNFRGMEGATYRSDFREVFESGMF